jgi:hypothetical protein
MAHPLYERKEAIRKNALTHLCAEPKVNNAFSWLHHTTNFFVNLPEIAVSEINQFLGENSKYYRHAKAEMLRQIIPSREEGLATYASLLDAIANQYTNMAQAHKNAPPKHTPHTGAEEEEEERTEGKVARHYL